MLEIKPIGAVLIGTGLGLSLLFGGASCVPAAVAGQVVAFVGLPIAAAGVALWRVAGQRVGKQQRAQLQLAEIG